MSRILAFIASIILLPVFLGTALLLICFQRFPVLFIQIRVGKDKKEFRIIKFRTMKNNRVTLIGKMVRNLGLDEIPQLINIIKGDMTFIGPRPLTNADIIRLDWDTAYYSSRWNVKPGITGMAQLAPLCHKKVTWLYDSYYSKNKSIILDLSIMLQTLIVAILGKQWLKKVKNR